MAVPSKVRSSAEVKEAVGSPRKRICWRGKVNGGLGSEDELRGGDGWVG